MKTMGGALMALGLSARAWASLCPSGSDPLPTPTGPGQFALACTSEAGASLCWEPPSGACQDDNTVTVEVDGTIISQDTYQGSGSPNICSQSFSLVAHLFSVGAHTVVTSQTAPPPDSDSFVVTVTAGPACDGDGDGVLNAADNCPGDPNAEQLDTDNDGDGDACDYDDDNDNCADVDDYESTDAWSRIGSRLAINCPHRVIPVLGWDGQDSDADGQLNCSDMDDDDDGLPDEDDPCPVHAESEQGPPSILACEFSPVTCPLQHWWDVCMFGSCNELLLRIQAVVNPDPTGVVFGRFEIVNRTLVIYPGRGESLEDVEAAVLGRDVAPRRGTVRRESGRLRLEIWSKDARDEPGEKIVSVAEYDPRALRVVSGAGRSAVVLTFERGGASVTMHRTTR